MRTYTSEFKRDAGDMVLSGKGTMEQIARDLGIDGSVLGRWRRKHLSALDGAAAPVEGMTPSESASENERLRRDNPRLVEQRDIF